MNVKSIAKKSGLKVIARVAREDDEGMLSDVKGMIAHNEGLIDAIEANIFPDSRSSQKFIEYLDQLGVIVFLEFHGEIRSAIPTHPNSAFEMISAAVEAGKRKHGTQLYPVSFRTNKIWVILPYNAGSDYEGFSTDKTYEAIRTHFHQALKNKEFLQFCHKHFIEEDGDEDYA